MMTTQESVMRQRVDDGTETSMVLLVLQRGEEGLCSDH